MASAQMFFQMAVAMAVAVVLVAGDPDSVLDFCVADTTSTTNSIRSTGFACKKVEDVVSSDFMFSLVPAPPAGRFELGIAAATADQWPGLNALGVSLLYLTFGEKGLVPAHTHTRASEIFYVLQGEVLCGFVSNAGELYQVVVPTGSAFVFPQGLLHFQKNVGKGPASGLSSFNSQSPGLQLISGALLNSSPKIDPSIIAQDWNVKSKLVTHIMKSYAS